MGTQLHRDAARLPLQDVGLMRVATHQNRYAACTRAPLPLRARRPRQAFDI